MEDPTRRFTDRVEGYARYRPSYPKELVDRCADRVPPPAAVIDVGSGTGILSGLLLSRGYSVWSVEPNRAMRLKAETDLSSNGDFHSVPGRAESTGLADNCCELVCCAQSFHWFANDIAVKEMSRIAQSGGIICLVWNRRRTDNSFSLSYHELMERHAVALGRSDHRDQEFETISRLFEGRRISQETYDNVQELDWEGLWGRVQSSSYAPGPAHPSNAPLFQEMRELYDSQTEYPVKFYYDTEAYFIEI